MTLIQRASSEPSADQFIALIYGTRRVLIKHPPSYLAARLDALSIFEQSGLPPRVVLRVNFRGHLTEINESSWSIVGSNDCVEVSVSFLDVPDHSAIIESVGKAKVAIVQPAAENVAVKKISVGFRCKLSYAMAR
jgi:hypothetical protein